MKKNNFAMNKVFRLMLVLCLLLSLVILPACESEFLPANNTESVSLAVENAIAKAEAMETHGHKVTKFKPSNHTIKNNINIEYMDAESTISKNGSYIKISGLKDKNVEQRINDKIRRAFYNLYDKEDIPPYRGVALKIQKNGDEIPTENIYCYAGEGSDNVISVSLVKSWSYQKYEYVYIAEQVVLNIDLNTGDEINLKDVFVDGFDYVSFLNNKVKEYIDTNFASEEGYYSGYDGYLKTIGKFETIEPDCVFGINNYTNRIWLVLDYRTPEFETHFMPETLEIELDDHCALNQRFISEESLFEDEKIKKHLITSNDNNLIGDTKYENVDIARKVGILGAKMSIRATYKDSIDKTADEFIDDIFSQKDELIESLAKACEEARAEYPGHNLGTYSSIYADVVDAAYFPYVYSNKNFSVYSTDLGYQTLKEFDESLYVTYDKKTKKPLKLEDLFVKNANIKELVIDSWKIQAQKQLDNEWKNEYSGYSVEDLEKIEVMLEDADQFFEDVFDSITGFMLYSEYIQLSFDDKVGKVLDFCDLEKSSDDWNLYCFFQLSTASDIEYDLVGYENLTIFN